MSESVLPNAGHHPDLHLVGWNNVTVEIWTHAVGNNYLVLEKTKFLFIFASFWSFSVLVLHFFTFTQYSGEDALFLFICLFVILNLQVCLSLIDNF